MSFEIDNQTLDDLNIFPKTKIDNSIFKIFNKTKTTGGQNALIEMMKNPSNDFELLSTRIEAIQFIQQNNIPFLFSDKMLDFIEHYLKLGVPPLKTRWIDVLGERIDYIFQPTNEYFAIESGIEYLMDFYFQLLKFKDLIVILNFPLLFLELINAINFFLSDALFLRIASLKVGQGNSTWVKTKKNLNSYFSINLFDNIIRTHKKDDILKLIKYIYLVDAYITIAKAGKENNFCLPTYHANGASLVNIENAFHPFVKEPVPNSISLDQSINMCFLTGANMAGKSTFLKSAGLCCYLAHLGFPVSAGKMETTVFSGLITTINLADNVSIGYSHFYSEVKRVKNTALKIQEKRKILVIFDELFRGTNVKDAYDASLMIISAFANINQCAFFISTHIVEIADELKKQESVVFKYFESDVVNETPIYSYKLLNGISSERHGLRIVKNEKIIEILEQIVENNKL